MRRWNPHDAPDDPPKDPEILGWFHALGPPPAGQAPPDLCVKVWARIAQRRARRGVLAWVPTLAHPGWAAALALVLVLSVGLNVWWGVLSFGPRPPGARPVADRSLSDLSAAGRLRTYRFQAEMTRIHDLGAVVAAAPPLQDPTVVMGFTPQAALTDFFRIGTLYAEALATLQGGTVEVASRRLDLLMQALARVQAPHVQTQYLDEVKTMLHRRQHEDEVLARFLALFEPLYEDVYATDGGTESLLLFRAGTWLENMYLAAASGDAAAVKRGGQAVDEVRSTLARLRAPRGVLEAFERLRPLVARQPLTDRDMQAVRILVQDMQTMLST
jgi:hypothetical protein